MSTRKTRPERRRAEQSGRRGETLAAFFLRLKGYRVIGRRMRTPVGEIDLVATRGGVLAFVEVKKRARRDDLERALGAVNQDRIVRAASYYVARQGEHGTHTIRFDVIFLAPLALPLHLRGAFGADKQRDKGKWV